MATDVFEMGPDLPHKFGVTQHCLAWKDDDIIMVVGGMIQFDAANNGKNLTDKVYEFNTRDGTFANITSLSVARDSAGCLVIDTGKGKELIVAGGMIN